MHTKNGEKMLETPSNLKKKVEKSGSKAYFVFIAY